ncbi:hypothetical protein [Paenibacillus chitinolyticus]|uniref:hypothetical protein n=1 Tax=Paenibacillus chitinolyticus TaxID=79263 RepID=UPI003CFDAD87
MDAALYGVEVRQPIELGGGMNDPESGISGNRLVLAHCTGKLPWHQLSNENLEAVVEVENDTFVLLREILPYD